MWCLPGAKMEWCWHREHQDNEKGHPAHDMGPEAKPLRHIRTSEHDLTQGRADP